MEYKGKLYGKVGLNGYFPMEETTEDVDNLKAEIKRLKAENEALKPGNNTFPFMPPVGFRVDFVPMEHMPRGSAKLLFNPLDADESKLPKKESKSVVEVLKQTRCTCGVPGNGKCLIHPDSLLNMRLKKE